MSDQAKRASTGAEAGPPSIEELLKASNWDERLAEARARREKILAQGGREPSPLLRLAPTDEVPDPHPGSGDAASGDGSDEPPATPARPSDTPVPGPRAPIARGPERGASAPRGHGANAAPEAFAAQAASAASRGSRPAAPIRGPRAVGPAVAPTRPPSARATARSVPEPRGSRVRGVVLGAGAGLLAGLAIGLSFAFGTWYAASGRLEELALAPRGATEAPAETAADAAGPGAEAAGGAAPDAEAAGGAAPDAEGVASSAQPAPAVERSPGASAPEPPPDMAAAAPEQAVTALAPEQAEGSAPSSDPPPSASVEAPIEPSAPRVVGAPPGEEPEAPELSVAAPAAPSRAAADAPPRSPDAGPPSPVVRADAPAAPAAPRAAGTLPDPAPEAEVVATATPQTPPAGALDAAPRGSSAPTPVTAGSVAPTRAPSPFDADGAAPPDAPPPTETAIGASPRLPEPTDAVDEAPAASPEAPPPLEDLEVAMLVAALESRSSMGAVQPAEPAEEDAATPAQDDAGAEPGPEAEPAPAAAGARAIYLHAPSELSEGALSEVAEALGRAGFTARGPIPVGFDVGTDHVRFYHEADREVAQAVARAIGGRARDFTDYRPSPAAGTIEIWLASTS